RARLRTGGRAVTLAELSRARGARVRRGPEFGRRGLRADDDAAYGQGARVSTGVPGGYGRRLVSAPALDGRPRRARGGAPALLCRHDARDAPALFHLCGATPAARR